jgi:hypothetical protein
MVARPHAGVAHVASGAHLSWAPPVAIAWFHGEWMVPSGYVKQAIENGHL